MLAALSPGSLRVAAPAHLGAFAPPPLQRLGRRVSPAGRLPELPSPGRLPPFSSAGASGPPSGLLPPSLARPSSPGQLQRLRPAPAVPSAAAAPAPAPAAKALHGPRAPDPAALRRAAQARHLRDAQAPRSGRPQKAAQRWLGGSAAALARPARRQPQRGNGALSLPSRRRQVPRAAAAPLPPSWAGGAEPGAALRAGTQRNFASLP